MRLFWLALAAWLAQLWVFVLPLWSGAEQAGLAQCVQLQAVFDAPQAQRPLPTAQAVTPDRLLASRHSHHDEPRRLTSDPHPSASLHAAGHEHAAPGHQGHDDSKPSDSSPHDHDCGFCLVLGHLALGGLTLALGVWIWLYSLKVQVWWQQIGQRRWRFHHPLSTAPPFFPHGA